MLVLSRNPEESIDIDTSDGPIRVMVSSIAGNRVRIGIDAPKACSIYRTEVLERLKSFATIPPVLQASHQ
jgi:carbon storage regulator CsrA